MELDSEQGDPSAPGSTRDALMDAALELLDRRGVLAGLNLREVADAVGVTPANIYHYFGSRQGLLRAALEREAQRRLAEPVGDLGALAFVERRLTMFDLIAESRVLALTALLALDRDPDYQPLPFLETTRAGYQALVDAGELRSDLDVDAAHLLSLATAIGFAIYEDAAARQLGITTAELHARARTLFASMLTALTARG